jgi:hypothetical protein
MEIALIFNSSLLNFILNLLQHLMDFIKAANNKILKNIFDTYSSKIDI